MTKAPCKFHLLQGACSSPVVCSASLFLPCSLQGYRLRCLCPDAMQHGRSVLQPLESLSRTWAAAMMHCRPGTLQSSGVSIRARHASPLRSRSSKLAKVPDQRSTTTRRYRPSELQERVRAGCKSACGASCCTASGTHTPSSLTSGDMNATPIYNHRSGSFGTGHPPHPQGLSIPGSLPSR